MVRVGDSEEMRRRRVPRRAFSRRVGILLKGEYSICKSCEIGEGGMLLESVANMIKGQQILVTFRLQGPTHTVVRGLVRYLHPQGTKFGIEFLNLDFQVKRSIRTYVASKLVNDVETETKGEG
ncbi:MAG: PilZ domain-containing protein [Bdellovibrionales bacterium]|nr:PilZ domain-containing protein [Bdellovibrionales bacterium]